MARPRKNSTQPVAVDRITQSFWDLLETHQLNEITVGMISDAACCNRGTFYYHFADIEALVNYVIEREFFDNGMPQRLFRLAVNGDVTALTESATNPSSHRLCLMMEHGGQIIAEKRIRRVLVSIWCIILGCDDSKLSSDARLIIEYSSHGMMGLIRYIHNQQAAGDDAVILPSPALIRDTSSFILTHMSKAQGISTEELLERVEIALLLTQTEQSAYSNMAVVR